MSKEEKQKELEGLKKKMLDDTTLPLKKGATNLVFGEGNPDCELLFVGEGPGYWEDQKGRPFVGNAGALLNQLLYLIKVPREEVFITNVVHHRPPGNRDPYPAEIEAYGKYLDELIEIIDPKIVITLGRFSMAKFLPDARISGVHGKTFRVDFKGKPLTIIPMYHPAAGLRSTEVKDKLTNDFKKIPDILQGLLEKKEVSKKDNSEQMKLI